MEKIDRAGQITTDLTDIDKVIFQLSGCDFYDTRQICIKNLAVLANPVPVIRTPAIA